MYLQIWYELGLDCFMLARCSSVGVFKGGPYLAGGGEGGLRTVSSLEERSYVLSRFLSLTVPWQVPAALDVTPCLEEASTQRGGVVPMRTTLAGLALFLGGECGPPSRPTSILLNGFVRPRYAHIQRAAQGLVDRPPLWGNSSFVDARTDTTTT